MSAAGVPYTNAAGQKPTLDPTGPKADGSQLASDFKQTYGSSDAPGAGTGSNATGGKPGQRFNAVTQRWEDADAHVVSSAQDASTGPGGGAPVTTMTSTGTETREPTLKEKIAGQAKVFRGKAFGMDHEVAKGEALLDGQGLEKAKEVGEQVKRQS